MKTKHYLIQIQNFVRRTSASTVTEYAVILVIVSIAAVAILFSIGQRTNSLLSSMNSNMP